MAQFQVPQFQVEERIIGPLTLKKFGYVAAAGLVCFILFFFLQFWLWLMVAAVVGGMGAAIAFITINGQPLDKIAVNAFGYFWNPRFYSWQRKEEKRVFELPTIKESPAEGEAPAKEHLAVRKNLKDLWQKLQTTKTPIPKREGPLKPLEEPMKIKKEKYGAFRAATGERIIMKKVNY